MGLKTPFEQKLVPDPSGDFAAIQGGVELTNPTGDQGRLTTPFDNAIVPRGAAGGKETANSLSGLPTQVETIQVDGAPERGTQGPWPNVDAAGIPFKTFAK